MSGPINVSLNVCQSLLAARLAKKVGRCAAFVFFLGLGGCALAPDVRIEPDEVETRAAEIVMAYNEGAALEANRPLTLGEAIALSALQNIDLLERRIDIAIAEGDIANSPLINGLSLSRVKSQDDRSVASDEENEAIARIDALTLGAAYFDARLQRSDTELKRELLAQGVQFRALEAIQLYYKLAAHQSMERKALDLLADLKRAKAANRKAIDQQLGDPLASLSAAQELGELEATLLDKIRAAILLRDQFRKLVGRPGQSPVRLSTKGLKNPKLPRLPQKPERLTAMMLLTRYDVIATYIEEEKARDTYRRTLMSWLPSASLEFTGEAGSQGEDFTTWNVSWNILNLAKVVNAKEIYALRQQLVELSRDRAVLTLDQDIQTLSELSRQSRLQYDVRSNNVSLSQQTYDALSASAQFRSGRLVLLKARLNLIEVEFNRDMALATHMSDVAQLSYAMGVPIVPQDWQTLSFRELSKQSELWETRQWDVQ